MGSAMGRKDNHLGAHTYPPEVPVPSNCLPIALGVPQAPTVATSPLPAVEVTMQTLAADPKIDLLI